MEQKPRNTYDNLSNDEAVKKMREIGEKCRTCMFVTKPGSFPQEARPMTLQAVDDDGAHYFISSKDSSLNEDITSNNKVSLYYQNNGSYEFLSIAGVATALDDKATIDKYWTDFAKAWFSGKDDPNVSIIKVEPVDSYYWESKDGKIISFAKMALAAFANLKFDDGGVEGKLNV